MKSMNKDECKDGCAVIAAADYNANYALDTATVSWVVVYLHCFCCFVIGVANRPWKDADMGLQVLVYFYVKQVPVLLRGSGFDKTWNTLCINYGVGISPDLQNVEQATSNSILACLTVVYHMQKLVDPRFTGVRPTAHFEYYKTVAGSPSYWGKSVWFLIHHVTKQVTDPAAYKIFLSHVTELLPCLVCRGHFRGILADCEASDKALEAPGALLGWTTALNFVQMLHLKGNTDATCKNTVVPQDFIAKVKSSIAKDDV